MARILCVEDDADLRAFVACALEPEGHELVFAKDGLEALARATGSPPDLVVMDLMMPTLSGWELLDELRAHETLASVPVLVTSLFSPMSGQLKDQDGHLAKPFEAGELVREVRTLLAHQPRGL